MKELYNNFCEDTRRRPSSDRALSSKDTAPMTIVCFPSSGAIDKLNLDLVRDESSTLTTTCRSSTSDGSQRTLGLGSRLGFFKLGSLGRRKPGLGRLTCPPKIPWLHHQDPAVDFVVNRRLYHLQPYNSVYPEFNALMDPEYSSGISAATASIPPGVYSRASEPIQSYTVDQPRVASQENLRFTQKSLSELDRRRQHRLSQRDSRTSLFSEKDTGFFERDRVPVQDTFHDDGQNSNSNVKYPLFKHTELRNNYVTGHQLLPPRNITLTPEKEQEDINSMGSTWVPSLHVRNTSIPRHNSFGLGSNSMPGQLSVSQAPIVTGSRRVNRTTSLSYISGRCQPRDDQGYADPLIGAPASLQQRLSELAGLEADTIRWERTKKTKKKPKDS